MKWSMIELSSNVISLLLMAILIGILQPTFASTGINEDYTILADTKNDTGRMLDLTQAQQNILDSFLPIMQDSKPIGEELMLVQFENLSSAIYSYDSHVQVKELDRLMDTLVPLVTYSDMSALAANGVDEVLKSSIEADEKAEIEALEDASDDG